MSSRRHTLGQLSGSQLNAREVGGPRGHGPAKKGSSSGRYSLAPPSRRLSQGPRASLGPSSRASMGYDGAAPSSKPARRQSTARKSVGGSRRSVGGRTSISGRPSIGARSSLGGRRSSLHKNSVALSDPRPLTEKSYKKESIKLLIEHLTETGYQHTICKQILSAPSNKDFTNIFKFLYLQIDPNYVFKDHLAEEIPMLLSQLRYPITINKSLIINCGSSHTWPKLLGALRWLVETIRYLEKLDFDVIMAQSDFGTGDAEAAGPNSDTILFFEYLDKSYKAFLEVNDQEEQSLDVLLQQHFENRSADIEQDMQLKQQETARMVHELEGIENAPNKLEALQAQKASLEADIQKFHQLIAQLEGHESKYQDRIAAQAAQLQAFEQQQADASAKKAQLEHIFQTQDMTQTDVERINSQRHRLDVEHKAVRQKQETVDQGSWRTEMALTKCIEEMVRRVDHYNRLLVDHVTPYVTDVEALEATLNTNSSDPSKVLSIDMNRIRPALENLREQVIVQRDQEQAQVLATEQALAEIEEAAADRERALELLARKMAQATKEYDMKKKGINAELEKKQEGIDRLQKQLMDMRLGESLTHEESHRRQQTLANQKAALEQRHKAELKAAQDSVIATLELVMEHKSHIFDSLTDLKAVVSGVA